MASLRKQATCKRLSIVFESAAVAMILFAPWRQQRASASWNAGKTAAVTCHLQAARAALACKRKCTPTKSPISAMPSPVIANGGCHSAKTSAANRLDIA